MIVAVYRRARSTIATGGDVLVTWQSWAMSVENFDQLGGTIEFLGEDTPENCFYCGKPLSGLTVYWHGVGTGIGMHPDCGLKLGAHLSRDAINARLISEGKPSRAGIGFMVE